MTRPAYTDIEFTDGTVQVSAAYRAPATAASLASANPSIPPGVTQAESDTGLVKTNTNTTATAYNSLGYVTRSFNGVGNPPSGALVMPWNVSATAAGQVVSGQLALYPVDVWPAPLSVKALACQITSAQSAVGTGALNQMVVYRDNGTGAAPLVTAAGLLANVAVATPTTAAIKLTTVSLTLAPGRYWAGLLYYQGTATITAAAYVCSTAGQTLWTPSTSFAVTRYLLRTGLTSVPTDGVAFTPAAAAVNAVVGLQAT